MQKGLVIVLVAFFAFEFLNFSGFCHRQLRYLSDAEFGDIAIAHKLSRQDASLESAGVPRERRIVYSSVADFKEKNPDCCSVHRWGHFLLPESVFFSRLFGYYNAVAQTWFRITNGEKEDFYDSYVFMGACGDIVGTSGMLEAKGPEKKGP